MFKRLLTLTLMIALFMVVVAAQAQTADSPTPLEIGAFGEGELTSDATEIYYTISVEEGAFILVEMRSAADSGLFSTALQVLDMDGNAIADSTGDVSDDVTQVAFVAPAAGDYTVVATRGEFSSDTGTFLVRAINLETLEDGVATTGTISNEIYDSYFAIPSDSNLEITYMMTRGEYVPVFQIAAVDRLGVLRTVASSSALDGIRLSASLETDDDFLYVVKVAANSNDYEFNEIDSDFELTLTVAE